MNAQLEQCLELLKGPDDEKRFVGMVLVTRIVKRGDEAANDTVVQVSEALGDDFLDRLLATPGEYSLLALHVLSVFCEVESLAARPRMLARVAVVAGMLAQQEARHVVVDILSSLGGIGAAGGDGGRKAVAAVASEVTDVLRRVASEPEAVAEPQTEAEPAEKNKAPLATKEDVWRHGMLLLAQVLPASRPAVVLPACDSGTVFRLWRRPTRRTKRSTQA